MNGFMFKGNQYRLDTYKNFLISVGLSFLGLAFWSVPLYRMFCESVGQGNSAWATNKGHDDSKVEEMEPNYDFPIVIRFKSMVTPGLPWEFEPAQDHILVYPGETALAFYTAKNLTDDPIIGVSTYNIEPYEAGQYFNKIQCFCFEEQILNPGESIDMPVFFFIDPDISDDANAANTEMVHLSYIFHRVESMEQLPKLPGFEHIKVQKAESLVKPF